MGHVMTIDKLQGNKNLELIIIEIRTAMYY